MAREYGFLVNGKWIESPKKREIRSPYNDEVVGVINIPTPKESKEAVDSAEKAFEKFKNTPSYERSEILRRIAAGIDRRKEELARTIVEENGKPIKTARVEVARAVMTFIVGAEEANRFSGGISFRLILSPEMKKGWACQGGSLLELLWESPLLFFRSTLSHIRSLHQSHREMQ